MLFTVSVRGAQTQTHALQLTKEDNRHVEIAETSVTPPIVYMTRQAGVETANPRVASDLSKESSATPRGPQGPARGPQGAFKKSFPKRKWLHLDTCKTTSFFTVALERSWRDLHISSQCHCQKHNMLNKKQMIHVYMELVQ